MATRETFLVVFKTTQYEYEWGKGRKKMVREASGVRCFAVGNGNTCRVFSYHIPRLSKDRTGSDLEREESYRYK